MKWFVSGTLVTLAVVGSVFAARHFASVQVCTAPRLSQSQMSTYSDVQLVGEYDLRAGMGYDRLELLKTHKFTCRLWVSCMGDDALIQGTWRQEGDVVTLTPDTPYKVVEEKLNLRYVPVSWGKQFYLVDENEMPGFCHSVYSKENIVSGRYLSFSDYVRRSAELFPKVQGKPKVPAFYKDFLEHGDIRAMVTSIGRHGYIYLKEKGLHRLKPGMRLCLSDSNDAPDIIVTNTDASAVRARPLPSVDQKKERIREGHVFTTGSNWDRPEGTWELALTQERQ